MLDNMQYSNLLNDMLKYTVRLRCVSIFVPNLSTFKCIMYMNSKGFDESVRMHKHILIRYL